MGTEDIAFDFIMHKECVSRLLKNLTAFNDDHLGYSPDTLTGSQLDTIIALQNELEELAEKYGLDAQAIIEEDD